jgi:hypothetical protein
MSATGEAEGEPRPRGPVQGDRRMSATGEAEGEPRPEGGDGARFRGGRRADDRMAVRSKETDG